MEETIQIRGNNGKTWTIFLQTAFFNFWEKKKEDKEDPEKSKKIEEFNFKKKCSYFFSNTKAKTGKQNNWYLFCLRKKYDYKNDHDILPHPPWFNLQFFKNSYNNNVSDSMPILV